MPVSFPVTLRLCTAQHSHHAKGTESRQGSEEPSSRTCSTSGGNLALRSRRQCTNRPTSASTCGLHQDGEMSLKST